MVELRIVIEGGVLSNVNISASTINNSEKLREGFHKLLSKMVNPDKFNLVVEIGAGEKNAAKSFKQYANLDDNVSLVIDLDRSKSLRIQKLEYLEVEEFEKRVFFMVQEMEAWIISQPDVIEECFNARYIREKVDFKIENDELFLIHPEAVSKPSEKLKVFLGRYYSEMKGNIKKKKKYGKLKDAPLLIENLDIHKLIATFDDIRLLKTHIEN